MKLPTKLGLSVFALIFLFAIGYVIFVPAKSIVRQAIHSPIVLAPGESITIYGATLPATEIIPTETNTLAPTNTTTSTNTPSPTNTVQPSNTPTETPSPTNTNIPMPTTTSTTVPDAVIERIVNVPYLGTVPTTTTLWTPSIFWFGQVTPDKNYAEVRTFYYDNYIEIVVHVIDRIVTYNVNPSISTITQWDSTSLYLNFGDHTYQFDSQVNWFEDRSLYQAVYVDGILSQIPFTTLSEWRGEGGPNDQVEDKGWNTTIRIPFSSIGLPNHPAFGTLGKMGVVVHDRDNVNEPILPDIYWPERFNKSDLTTWGKMHFGIPTYSPPQTSNNQIVSIQHGLDGQVVKDAEVGGHTVCGDPYISDFYGLWGNANYAGYPQINIQNQWDIADWPCFSKYFVTFPLNKIPPGKTIVSATFSMYLFGTAGGGVWGEPPDTYIQALTTDKDWDENTITWNNAPYAIENFGGTWVHKMTSAEWVLYTWDVSAEVAQAYTKGQPARLIFYEADGPRHTGKYFVSSDESDYNATTRPILKVMYGDACVNCTITSTPTNVPTATPTNTATLTPIPTMTNTPVPVATFTPTRTPTRTFTPTNTPIPTYTRTPTRTPTSLPSGGNTFYVSPSGSDGNTCRSETSPCATFNHVWPLIYPGDTLILLDGTYYQSLNPNVRNGQAGKPITIKAKNDGQAVIDGQNKRIPVKLGDTWPGPIGNYFTIEGIVAKNSSDAVILIDAVHDNIIRRVSAYNANTNSNSSVISIDWSTAYNNLIEDSVAGGTGRKMVMIYEGHDNIIRRVVAYWNGWNGANFCGVTWPWGDGIQVYSGDYNIIENSISLQQTPSWSISVQANDPSLDAIGNKILGSIALNAGRDMNGNITQWGNRPQPNDCDTNMQNTDLNWPAIRAGFVLYGQGLLKDNLFQDIFAWGNATWGISQTGEPFNPNNSNNVVRHATIFNNGLDMNCVAPWPCGYGGKYTDASDYYLGSLSLQDSFIQKIYVSGDYQNRVLRTMNGTKADLTHQYINGTLTNAPLWPWPMEQRILSELGFSITNYITNILNSVP